MRVLLFAVFGLFLIYACSIKSNTNNDGITKPNIIVILIDDAGYADFGFMGSKDLLTPEIDKLASKGVIFTDAHTSSTVCSPSRAGLMTGRYQQRFGFECNGIGDGLGLDTTEVTLASALKNSGYKTIALGKWHLGNKQIYQPNNRGFDEFYGFLEGSRHYFYNQNQDDSPNNPHALLHNKEQIKFEGYLTDDLGDKAVNYIDEFKNKPFFMYVSFNAVHTPLEAKEADLKRFEGHPRQLLAAMTWSLDQNVGKITKKLEQENLLKNTLIFFLSDNGGAHNNQSSVAPLKGWKGNEFEGGHRVPFFMSWQGKILANQKYNKLTSSLDIYATSLAVANIKFPKNKPLDGVNLMQHITNQNNNAPHQMLFWRKDEDAAARIGNLKLIRLKNYGSALYNLDDNIAETKDLAKSNPSQLKDLESALKNWETKLVNPLWTEGIPWTTATFEIHKALMNNRQPKKKQP